MTNQKENQILALITSEIGIAYNNGVIDGAQNTSGLCRDIIIEECSKRLYKFIIKIIENE